MYQHSDFDLFDSDTQTVSINTFYIPLFIVIRMFFIDNVFACILTNNRLVTASNSVNLSISLTLRIDSVIS